MPTELETTFTEAIMAVKDMTYIIDATVFSTNIHLTYKYITELRSTRNTEKMIGR